MNYYLRLQVKLDLIKNETFHDAVEKWQSLDIQVKQVTGEPHLNHNHPSLTQHKVP